MSAVIAESLAKLAEVEKPANPFPGLRPFEFHESHLFFGRDGQSEQLIAKLAATHFLAVVGTSGSGKSSLVRAGLLPALFGGMMASAGSQWRVAVMRPGNDPVGNLANALNAPGVFGTDPTLEAGESIGAEGVDAADQALQTAILEATLRRGSLGLIEAVRQANLSGHENLLILVDQFEELFRVEHAVRRETEENDKAAFVKLLLEAGGQRELPLYVLLTMRSDYLGDCAQFWDLPEAINAGQYLIPRMTREQCRASITGPVAVGGAEGTPRLVNHLLNDVGDNPDQLPILQHALMRTWEQWQEEGLPAAPLDLRHYQAIGGMAEALSRHADEAFKELSEERQKLAEQMFKCLTEKGPDNREIRRPLTVREIGAVTGAEESEIMAVIDVFRHAGRSFLMPPVEVRLTAEALIDISHESLIRQWQRLRDWVEDEAQSARDYRRLAEDAMGYGKGETSLWRDPELQIALNWRERIQPNAPWAQRYYPAFEQAMRFLDESREAREGEALAREAEARAKELQRRRELTRIRVFASIVAIAFIISSVLAGYAYWWANEAEEQEKTARQLNYVANINLAQGAFAAGNFEVEGKHSMRFCPPLLHAQRMICVVLSGITSGAKIIRSSPPSKATPTLSGRSPSPRTVRPWPRGAGTRP